jgi:uridine phosphorylase
MEAHITARGLLESFGVDPQSPYPKKALLVGQKERLSLLLEGFREIRPIVSFLGVELYEAHLGTGAWIVGLSGLFAPQAALALELVFALGVKSVIRVGSSGTFLESAKIGDVILASGAIIEEGTSPAYLPKSVPYLACPSLLTSFKKPLEDRGLRLHTGLVVSVDALLKETPEFVARMKSWNVLGVDMVTSVFLALSQAFKAECAAALVVSDNLITHEIGFFQEAFQRAESMCLEAALSLGDI